MVGKTKNYELGPMPPSYELTASPPPQGEYPIQEDPPQYSNGTAANVENGGHPVHGEPEEDRGQWGHKAEFILSCVGLSVGLGNVWRFPYLAYRNGGAAFVIAYLVLQLLIGKPMYFMELVMGQFSGKGPTKVWEMNPSAKGIGIAMCLISLVTAIYYNIIMCYTLYYFFATMQRTLPWTKCKEEWSRNETWICVEDRTSLPKNCSLDVTYSANETCVCTTNTTIDFNLGFDCTLFKEVKTSAELYFERDVIERADTINPSDLGAPLWRLVLCLLLSWIIVVLCLIKGIKSSGKVVYFTATFPYIILLVLLVRGATLDGAVDGVKEFVIPDWDELGDINVWVAAAGQMFFSLSVTFGGIIIFGSYNKFRNGVYYDALFISMMDLVTSVVAGFVVFTTLGHLAHELDTDVDEVAEASYGLAFATYPEALAQLPVSHLWCLIFFFMLFTLGLDSEFAFMETILTSIQDEFPKLRKHKSKLSIGLGIVCFGLALPCTTKGGDYVVSIMDHFGADFSVLVLACVEVISVMWVYGSMRFISDVELMLGSKPGFWPYWLFTWTVSSPILIGALILYRFIDYSPPEYPGGEAFPDFALAIGWVLFTVVLSPVPITFFYRLIKGYSMSRTSDFSIVSYMFSSTSEWVPNDPAFKVHPRREVQPATTGMTNNKQPIDNPAFVPDY